MIPMLDARSPGRSPQPDRPIRRLDAHAGPAVLNRADRRRLSPVLEILATDDILAISILAKLDWLGGPFGPAGSARSSAGGAQGGGRGSRHLR
jgi:hypothetical protein